MDKLKLNVGGSVFEISSKELLKYPNTLLGNLNKSCKYYDSASDTFFFSRNPEMFNNILDLYRVGVLHLPSGTCGSIIHEELDFWKLPLDALCECCAHEYFTHERDLEAISILKRTFEEDLRYNPEAVRSSKVKFFMNKIWLVIDQPKSSVLAKIINVITLAMVLLSVVSLILATNKEYRVKFIDIQTLIFYGNIYDIRVVKEMDLNNTKVVTMYTTEPTRALRIIDLVCAMYFSTEFLLHFVTCPKKLKFVTFPLNIIDGVLFFDVITVYLLEEYMQDVVQNYHAFYFFLVAKALVSLRLFRLFRFMKVFSGFRILLLSLKHSLRELFLLFLAFMCCSVLFASFIHYAEFYTRDTFPNLQEGIWWSIITMTTVGYGDMYPKSGYGYAVGTLCASCGLIILALPITVVATKFSHFYSKNKVREDRKRMTERSSNRMLTSVGKVCPESDKTFKY